MALDVIQPGRIDVSSKSLIWDYTGATLRCDTPLIGTDAANKDYVDSVAGGGGIWGTITGTLSNQLDLQAALDLKFDAADFDSSFDTRLATKDTGDLAEGVNLYYTQARFDAAFAAKDTDDLSEGATNLYWDYDADSQNIVNVADPVNPQDAATKVWVEAQITAEDFWDRAGTTLTTHTSGDSVSLDANATYQIETVDMVAKYSNNYFFGNSGISTVSGAWNMAVGDAALSSITTGNRNNAWGYLAGRDITTGSKNNIIGAAAGITITDGEENCAVGNQTFGGGSTNPNRSVAIGYQAGLNSDQDDCVLIGHNAGYSNSRDNTLYIANTNTATPLIYGEFDTPLLQFYAPTKLGDDTQFLFGDSGNLAMEYVSADNEFCMGFAGGGTEVCLTGNTEVHRTTNFQFKPIGTSVLWENFAYGGGTSMRNKRAQGIEGAEESIVNGAILNQYFVQGYHENGGGPGGGDYYSGAEIRFTVDAAIGASAEMPTRYELYLTPDASTTPELAFAIGSDKLVHLPGTLGVGTLPGTIPLEVVGTLGEFRITQREDNSTTKQARYTMNHYTIAEQPLGVMVAQSTSTANTIAFGGGSSLVNAATSFSFYAAANNTTTTGSAKMVIDGVNNATYAGLNSSKVGVGYTTGAVLPDDFSVNGTASIYEDSSSTIDNGLRIEQDGTGDARMEFLLTGGQAFSMGIDNSDSDKFKMAIDTDVGINTWLEVDTSKDVFFTPNATVSVDGDIELTKTGEATAINQGLPSHEINLIASDWIGGVATDVTTTLSNYQPVGGDGATLGMSFDGDLRYIWSDEGVAFVGDAAGGDTCIFAGSVAPAGKGVNMTFRGGNAVAAAADGGDLRMEPGEPGAGGVPGTINFGQSGLADQGCVFFKSYMRYQSELDYSDDGENHNADALETSDALDNTISYSDSVPDNAVIRVEVTISAVESDGSDRGTYRISGVFYRDGGNISQQGSTVYDYVETSDLNWDVTFSLNTVDQLAEVQVNGNGDTVRWTSFIKDSIVITT